jgi:hypothetical protein
VSMLRMPIEAKRTRLTHKHDERCIELIHQRPHFGDLFV